MSLDLESIPNVCALLPLRTLHLLNRAYIQGNEGLHLETADWSIWRSLGSDRCGTVFADSQMPAWHYNGILLLSHADDSELGVIACDHPHALLLIILDRICDPVDLLKIESHIKSD